MSKHNTKLLISASCFALASTIAMPAFSQETSEAEDSVFRQSTVTVTAERRESDILDAPIAVTALSPESLEAKGVTDFSELQNAAPSLSISDASVTKNVNIRGIGLNVVSPAVSSGVAIYRDNLFMPNTIGLNEPFFDIASIEVLRGPQGTFVGQNSTGGAVLINTQDPVIDGEHDANLGLEVGNYNRFRLSGATDVPINDILEARVAFNMERRDSFYDNVGGDAEPGSVDQMHFRGGLRFEPSDVLGFTLKVDAGTRDTGGFASVPIPQGDYGAFAPSGGDFTIAYNRDDVMNEENTARIGLEGEYEFTDAGHVLRSVTGYQHLSQDMFWDDDATTQAEQYRDWSFTDNVFSQEFNIISPEAERLRWILGAYYYEDVLKVDLYSVASLAPGIPATVGASTSLADVRTQKNGQSVFGQVAYDLTDTVEIEVGARYSQDETQSTLAVERAFIPPLFTINLAFDDAFTDENVTGKIGVNWDVTEDQFIYAFVAEGYKAGALNPGGSVADAERVRDYEIGWKASLFDGRLRSQFNAFYMEYENYQQTVVDIVTGSGLSTVQNTGESEIQGFEYEASLSLGNWMFDLGMAYVDSSIGSISLLNERGLPAPVRVLGAQCAAGQTTGCFDYTPFIQTLDGRQNPYSPELTYSLGVQYVHDMENGELILRGDYTHTDEQYASLFQDQNFDLLEERDLLNASISYVSGDWRVQLYGTNLTDEVYRSGYYLDQSFFNGAPRQFGVRVNRNF
jgi:iron complex outermembrane receptor protein